MGFCRNAPALDYGVQIVILESGLKWARSMFGQIVGDKQAIFVIPHEVTLRDNSVVPAEKMVFTGEEFFATMRG